MIEALEIPLPPLSEQRAIAHVLGTLDDKIELNRRMNETLEEMARALFKSWFVDFLPVRAKMAAKQNNPSLLLPQAESGTWFVYAIECADGSLDIGQTENLRQRWLQHSSSKGGRWTKSHPPQRVAYWEKQPSRQAAVEREKWLKTGFGRKWLKKEIATRRQTGDPVRAKIAGRDTGLPPDVADLFPDRLVDSELGPIPEGWGVADIESLCVSITSGGTPARNNPIFWERGTIPWYKTGELLDGPLIDSEEYITETAISNSSAKLWPAGTILFALYASPTVGRLGVLAKPGTANQATAGIIAKSAYGVPFLRRMLIEARDSLKAIAVGAAQQNINQRVLKTHRLIVPKTAVAGAYSRLMTTCDDQQAVMAEASRTLASLRDALLPKLVSGEVRVDPGQEIGIMSA